MPKKIGNSPFIYDDKGIKVLGVDCADGTIAGFINSYPTLAEAAANSATGFMVVDGVPNNLKSKKYGFDKLFSGKGANAFAGRTWVTQLDAGDAFYAFQIVLENYDTVNVCPITTAVAAAAPATSHTGVGLSWQSITFGAVLATNAAGTPGASIPAATAGSDGYGIIPGLLVSDVIYLKSIARTDIIGAKPLLQVRIKHGDTINIMVLAGTCSTGAGLANAAARRDARSASYTGDAALVATAGTIAVTPAENSVFMPVPTIKFFYRSKCLDFVYCGDSTFAGLDALGQSNFSQIAAGLASNSGRLVNAINCSLATRTQSQAYNYAIANVFTYKPKYLLWQTWSVNNTDKTATGFALAKQQTLNMIQLCIDNDVGIILTTQFVNMQGTGATTATVRDLLLEHNAFIGSLGFPVFDIASLITDGSGINIVPAYLALLDLAGNTTGNHWNAAGNSYLGGVLASYLNVLAG